MEKTWGKVHLPGSEKALSQIWLMFYLVAVWKGDLDLVCVTLQTKESWGEVSQVWAHWSHPPTVSWDEV